MAQPNHQNKVQSKRRHNKPSEQGSRSKLSDTKSHQNKVQELTRKNSEQGSRF
nr:hypothetical protein [Mycoplasmopsis bovis]